MSDIRTPEVDALLEVFAHVTNPDDIFKLFEDLLTVREIKDTSQRLDVARMLKAGKSYTAIEQKTGASATTIARVSKALNYGAGGYAVAFEVLEGADGVLVGDEVVDSSGSGTDAPSTQLTQPAQDDNHHEE